MKKQLILTIVFTLAFTSAAFAQIKQISSNDYYNCGTNAFKLMYGKSLRYFETYETFENGATIDSVTITRENLPPGRSRSFTVETKDGKETSLELILIGTLQYRRENGGQWTVKDLRSSVGSTGASSGSAFCTQYTEESDFVEGVQARKLKQFRISQSTEGLMFDEQIQWIDQQGFFVRRERIKGNLEPRTVKTRSVAVYEYDPTDLKIEAPIQ